MQECLHTHTRSTCTCMCKSNGVHVYCIFVFYPHGDLCARLRSVVKHDIHISLSVSLTLYAPTQTCARCKDRLVVLFSGRANSVWTHFQPAKAPNPFAIGWFVKLRTTRRISTDTITTSRSQMFAAPLCHTVLVRVKCQGDVNNQIN